MSTKETALETVTPEQMEKLEEARQSLIAGNQEEVSTIAMFASATSSLYSSIDTSTEAGKLAVYNAINDTEGNLCDHIGEVFTITDLVAFPVTFWSDQENAMVDAMRISLIDDKGQAWGTVAKGILGSVKTMIGLYGAAPWPNGIQISPRQKKTRNGFNTVILRIVAQGE